MYTLEISAELHISISAVITVIVNLPDAMSIKTLICYILVTLCYTLFLAYNIEQT
jgi:hypothetical protein